MPLKKGIQYLFVPGRGISKKVKMRDVHRVPACHVGFQFFFAKLVTPILLHVCCEGLYLQVMEGFGAQLHT